MDSSRIKGEELMAMKCYKNSQFVYNLILSSLVALTCSFFCSQPFGFVSLTCSIKYFLFISLPNIWSSFLNPKCLFIVFNVIVAFLVGESKLLGSQTSPAPNDIYEEYVERSTRRIRGVQHECLNGLGEKKREEIRKVEVLDVSEEIVCEDKVIALEHKEDKHEQDEKLKEEEDDDEEFKEAENNAEQVHEEGEAEEESDGLPAEELNRRVEDFIARINKQRWLEARMLICGQA